MKVTNRDSDLPIKAKKGKVSSDVICPFCHIEFVKEAVIGQSKIHCNYCGADWRVNTHGIPNTRVRQ